MKGKQAAARLFAGIWPVLILFALVFAARLWYVAEISITTNQHDTSSFSRVENNYGHTGYIRYLMEEKQLPDFDVRGKSQFYHPPLHHITCAVFLQVQTALGVPFDTAAENLQLLTLTYSMIALYAVYRILKQLKIEGLPQLAVLTVIGFHPTFFLLSGSINNDCMSLMFTLLAVWVTLLWMEKQTFGRIVALALCIGCAMAAKLTAGVIAPAVAIVFLYKLLRQPDWASRRRLLAQFCVFGILCIPLGIGWQVRNYVRFGVPLTYVPRLSNKATQYLGGYSLGERFFDWKSLRDFGVYPMRTGVQGARYFEHCIPLAALKMALFGEYSVWKDVPLLHAFANPLFWYQALLVLASLGGVALTAVRWFRGRNQEGSFFRQHGFGGSVFLFLLLYGGTMLVSYVMFCFSYPHFCSMDYRYIVPTLLLGGIFLGLLLKWLHTRPGNLAFFARAVLYTFVVAFAICSVMLYPVGYWMM